MHQSELGIFPLNLACLLMNLHHYQMILKGALQIIQFYWKSTVDYLPTCTATKIIFELNLLLDLHVNISVYSRLGNQLTFYFQPCSGLHNKQIYKQTDKGIIKIDMLRWWHLSSRCINECVWFCATGWRHVRMWTLVRLQLTSLS